MPVTGSISFYCGASSLRRRYYLRGVIRNPHGSSYFASLNDGSSMVMVCVSSLVRNVRYARSQIDRRLVKFEFVSDSSTE